MGYTVCFSVLRVGINGKNYVWKKAVWSLTVSRSPQAHGWKGPQLVLSDLGWRLHSVSWGPARGVMLMSCKDDSVSGHRSSWCLCGLFLTRKNSQYSRKWRGTKKPLDESKRREWKSWLKDRHSENEDHGIQSHHFIGNRWRNSGNSVRLYFFGLQNHCRWWLQPWN